MTRVYFSLRALIIVILILGSLFTAFTKVSLAATPFITGATAPQTELQLLMNILLSLQSQLALLQKTASAETMLASTSTAVVSTTTAYDIIIVAGQSNSVGFGEGTYTEDAKYVTAENKAKVFELGRCPGHDMKIIPVVKEPLEFWGRGSDCNITNTKKYGSAYPLALRLASTETTGRKVLIIPAAKGGTSILQWDKVINNFASTTDTTVLYDDMVMRAKAVLALNPKNKIVAVMWRQGEEDAIAITQSDNQFHSLMSTSTYQTKLIALRNRLRRDLSSQGCFPFLFGEMTKQWAPKAASKIGITSVIQYVASHDTCSTTTNQSVFVPSDLTMTTNAGELIHFNAFGQWLMAKKMWTALQPFLK